MATASPCPFIMQQPAQIIWFGVTVTQHPKLPRPVFALQKMLQLRLWPCCFPAGQH